MMMRTTEALDHEWRADFEHTCEGARCVRRWARTEPALRGLSDLGAVLDARRDRDRSTEVLAALARLAPADTTAARTLLQALLPGIVDLALKQFSSDGDAFEELVSLAWERIRTYPPNRRGSVAGNVLMDARKRYLAGQNPNGWAEMPVAEPDLSRTVPSAEHCVLVGEALRQFFASANTGLISRRAYDMILRTRVGDDPIREVAADHDMTAGNVVCVRWRAERRLQQGLDPAA